MGTLAVDNIQHTDGSSAVTLNNATITTGTVGSGVTGGSGLTALGTVTTGNISHADIVYPAGHILQVVQLLDSTKISNTTVNQSLTLMTKAITPLNTGASDSKIFVECKWWEGGSNPNGAYRILRDSVSITTQHTYVGGGVGFMAMDDAAVGLYALASNSFSILDSPSIPSTPVPITYIFGTHVHDTVYFNVQSNGIGGGTSSITLWEIAG